VSKGGVSKVSESKDKDDYVEDVSEGFADPKGMAVDTEVYLSDGGKKRIAVFTRDGQFVKNFVARGLDGAPKYGHIAILEDELYVYCEGDSKVQVFA